MAGAIRPLSKPSSVLGSLITPVVIILITGIIWCASGSPPPEYCSESDTATKPYPSIFRPNPARVFPFCVGKDPETDQWPVDGLLVNSGFAKIIDDIDKRMNQGQEPQYKGFLYDAGEHFFVPDNTANGKVLIEMKPHLLLRKTERNPDDTMQYSVVLDFVGLRYKELASKRGFITNKPVVGLYIQAIQGPLGIPFGRFMNFDLKFGKNEDEKAVKGDDYPTTLASMTSTPDCTFYSMAEPSVIKYFTCACDYQYNIPNVLIQSSLLTPGYRVTTSKVKVIFQWEDRSCAEVAFFQFMIIVVWDDWGTGDSIPLYRTALTQVLLPGRLKFKTDGIPTLYNGNDVLGAHENNNIMSFGPYDSSDWKQYRIVSNLDYEHCVQHKVGLVRTGSKKGACPPGPFQCPNYIQQRPTDTNAMKRRKQDIWNQWKGNYHEYNDRVGRPDCPPPPGSITTTTTTTTTTPITKPMTTEEPPPPTTTVKPRNETETEKVEAEVAKVAVKVERKKVISHGELCIFIWFVLIPIANHFARFFKDFPNWEGLGVGFWVLAHIIIHHVCVLLMWISFGLVVSNGASFLGGAGVLHYVYGFPATFIQHFELFNAFSRDKKSHGAYRQSIVHAIIGYASTLLSLLCALESNIADEKWYLVIGLFTINVVAIIAGNMMEKKIDMRLGVFPPRKAFPILQRIVMINAKPLLYKQKIIMVCVYILGISALYFCLLNDFFKDLLNIKT